VQVNKLTKYFILFWEGEMKPSLNLWTGKKYIYILPVIIIVLAAAVMSVDLLARGEQDSPDLNVTVDKFEPQGEVDRETNITVKFSREMVPEDSLDLPLLDPPLEIDPPLPGVARWIETDILRFYPDQKLRPATEYRAKIKSNKTFYNGNMINEEREFTFAAKPLQVDQVYYDPVYTPEKPGYASLVINVVFNYMVNVEQFKKKIKIEGGENAWKDKLEFEVTDHRMTETETAPDGSKQLYASVIILETEPIMLTEDRQEFILKVENNLNCYTCENPLRKEFTKSIFLSAKQQLFVKDVRPQVSGEKGVIAIYLSDGVSDEDARKFITISPEINFNVQSSYRWLRLIGDFEPGRTYTITVAEGMPSLRGSLLEDEFSTITTIPNLPPTIRFTSLGMYLPRDGAGLLEVETINVDTLLVEIERVFTNNMLYALATGYGTNSGYRYRSSKGLLGKDFFSADKYLDTELNQPLKTTIDVGGIIPDTAKGIFLISARNKTGRWKYDSRMIMMTDIGIMARMSDDYLTVWVNSLSETKPLKDASVTLVSYNNQTLLTGKTDSRGIAVFDDIARQTDGFVPYLITVTYKNDISFLKFDNCLLPTEDFDIKGRPYLTSGYEAFMYPDRGIFRPGETAHISSVVRGARVEIPDEFPYFIIVYDPSGREFKSYRASTEESAFLSIDLEIPTFAPTGKYTVIARIGEDLEIGRTDFQVEEFMPDRIKVDVTTTLENYRVGDTVEIDVKGTFLFGPPAAGHNVGGLIIIEDNDFSPKGYSEYSFLSRNKKFAEVRKTFNTGILDDNGSFTFTYPISPIFHPPSALKGLISVDVSEQGGRTVSNFTEININPYMRYVGIRKNFEHYVKPGQLCTFNLVALNTDGSRTSMDSALIRLNRVIYNSILKKDDKGRYRYVSEKTLKPYDSMYVSIPSDGSEISLTPPDYGYYQAEVIDLDGGHAASTDFYASGWGYAPWSMENPDQVEIGLDKSKYYPGENATVQIRAPFGGKLLLTIEKEKVLEYQVYDMAENTAEIKIPVKKDFFPNAYITATVIKKAADVEPSSPARAFGVAPISLNLEDEALALDISCPDIIKPNTKLTVGVKVGRPDSTELTLAAVDAGILQVTGFETPDPLNFFYGKKKLHLKPYDIYSLLYPEIERAESHLSPAGGISEMAQSLRVRHLNPITAFRVKPVALWSGIVRTDETGLANIDFEIPEFNGKLILMAVAVHGNSFGSATDEIIVRDNIVLQESFPRFLSPNDELEGLVTVFNNTGRRTDISVQLESKGPIEIISPAVQTLNLRNNAEGKVIFRLKAGLVPGKIEFRIHATDGTDRSEINFELPNRPTQPLVTKFGSGVITENNDASFVLPGGWLEGTDNYLIRTSSFAAASFTRNINYLVHYPYGCLEQTTSGLFPLLYFNDLARFVQPEVFGTKGPDYFIKRGIIKLKSMMRQDGLFAFWPGSAHVNYWSSVYASHFLLEADKAGFYVDEKIKKQLISTLKGIAQGKKLKDDDPDSPVRIYAAYVLAQSGEIDKKSVNAVKSLANSDLPVFSKFHLAGVLALTGDLESAMHLIPAEIHPDNAEPETGGNFNSGVRSNAILLEVLNEIDPDNPSCPVLAKSLMEDARLGRWYTTQSTAFALMALGKYLKGQKEADYTGTVTITRDSTYQFNTEDFVIDRKGLGDKVASISITGEGSCFYYWQASGVPASNAPDEFTRGIKVSREYLDSNGKPLDLNSIPIGSQVVCHLKAVAVNKHLYNVVINDLLPAGFEIENPRLLTTPRLSWIPSVGVDIDHHDIRDDRLLVFTGLSKDRPLEIYYSLRAISAGNFKIPPVAAECMYNPLIAGSSSSGNMTVVGNDQ